MSSTKSSPLYPVDIEKFTTFTAEPLPEAEWLIDRIFERDSLALLFGASGEGKSFVSLSMAIAIASGTPWLDTYATKQGPVVYAIGEGPRGMRRRAFAAARHAGLKDIPELYFYPAAPQLRTEAGCDQFLKLVKPLNPALVVIDTLARSFVGGDENTAKDMGEWVAAATRIQRETGACVMPIHHTAKNKKPGMPPTERGSNSLRGAVDTSIGVSMKDGVIQLVNYKQKDDEVFKPIHIATETFVIKPATEEKPAMTTLVLSALAATIPPELMADVPELALDILSKAPEPLSKTEWLRLLHEEQRKKKLTLTAKATFFRWPEKWVKEGGVVEVDGKYQLAIGGGE